MHDWGTWRALGMLLLVPTLSITLSTIGGLVGSKRNSFLSSINHNSNSDPTKVPKESRVRKNCTYTTYTCMHTMPVRSPREAKVGEYSDAVDFFGDPGNMCLRAPALIGVSHDQFAFPIAPSEKRQMRSQLRQKQRRGQIGCNCALIGRGSPGPNPGFIPFGGRVFSSIVLLCRYFARRHGLLYLCARSCEKKKSIIIVVLVCLFVCLSVYLIVI